jgi:RHS repeat-associated protein
VTQASSVGTYTESYTYDSKTRPWVKSITIPGDTTYAYTTTYNATTGFADTLTYPASTLGYQLKLQYGYANGLLNKISDFNAPSTIFWTANATNLRGQVTQETLGNGVTVNRSFDAITGWLGSLQAGVGGGATLQNAGFLYDLLGNVTQRQNSNLGLTENFFYDADSRLDHSTLNNLPNLQMAYDTHGMGNIASRSDIAANTAWTYDPVRKHAVTQAGTGGYSYTYDNNGNAMTRNGYPITWTSYNYPSSVASAGESAQFWYGPDRQRYKTIYTGPAGIETTYHVGKLLEKVISSGAADYRHYIFAGNEKVAIYDRSASGTNTLYYALNDNQGSIASVVTNSTPGPVANYVTESFTAFGNLRSGATWSGAAPAIDTSRIEGTSRDAYTGQTALGVQGLSMGLNHMNGRIQDAITGRFLSPDPYIPDPGNTQSLNRYSYVNNNPLRLSDPTGFDDEGGGGGGDLSITVEGSGGWFAGGWSGPQFACPCARGVSLHFPTQGQGTAQSSDARSKPATDTSDTANRIWVTDPGPEELSVTRPDGTTERFYDNLGTTLDEVVVQGHGYHWLNLGTGPCSDCPVNLSPYFRDPEFVRRNPLRAFTDTIEFGVNGALFATTGFSAFNAAKGIFSAAANPAVVISRVAQAHADSGLAGLAKYMSKPELAAVESGSKTSSAILGQAVHNATAETLGELYPGAYKYFSRAPFDFVYAPTGEVFELTTLGQAAGHADRGATLLFYGLGP